MEQAIVIAVILAFLSVLLPSPLNVISIAFSIFLLFIREIRLRRDINSLKSMIDREILDPLAVLDDITVRGYADQREISWKKAKKDLDFLVEKGILKKNGDKYILTEDGKKILGLVGK
ncbi:winged helix-turn-helix domain-containing protein [Candidatus Methanodesulfokora washburnensis]|uniref:ArnR1-like winged helix-turn-helix domain-containing protein n=1 Tax=Candidatus Methanodesulfokora washburnensis TaxID=2478471 RepID=A0A429GF10_9CREN|nr:winged helix-turn-helix domain-containing protein [Candidatus Methanodesulfokores washburnensis]RSN72444.1 hypothetical protein D6D85_13820 [Candidatus Methanodesulfokores washburnensis]